MTARPAGATGIVNVQVVLVPGHGNTKPGTLEADQPANDSVPVGFAVNVTLHPNVSSRPQPLGG